MNRRVVLIAISIASLCLIGYAAYWLSTKSRRTLRNEIIGMQGKKVEICFNDAEAYHSGIDSVYDTTSMMKLVVFVDSISCSGCFLNKLITYFEINDSLVKKRGELLVILNPKKNRIDEIRKTLLTDKNPFWCILDKNGDFSQLNPWIPDNELLHTFLLDENNGIILVGDPSSNPKIRELFMKQLANQ